MQAILAMAEPNDLRADLRRQRHPLLEADHLFRPRPGDGGTVDAVAAAEPLPPDDLPPLEDLGQLPAGATLIRDERGVRLAREPEEAD